MNKNAAKGFSAIELVIVISILVVLVGIITLPLSKNRQARFLLQSADDVVSALNTAHAKTLSAVNSSQYGVKFETNKVTMFTGDTYNSGATDNNIVSLQSGVEINSGSILLNGSATSIVFDRLTGNTNQYGTITLRLVNDISKTKTITVEKTGLVKLD